MFINKIRLLLILLATTICSQAQAKPFSDELADKIETISSINDVAGTIQWLTEQIKKKPTLRTYGTGSLFSYERNFCQPIRDKLKQLKDQKPSTLTDDVITDTLAPGLTALISVFKENPQSDLGYTTHLMQLNQLSNEIVPIYQPNDELIEAIRQALEEVKEKLRQVNSLEPKKIDAQRRAENLSLTSQQLLEQKHKELEVLTNELRKLRKKYLEELAEVNIRIDIETERYQERLKELEDVIKRANLDRAHYEQILTERMLSPVM